MLALASAGAARADMSVHGVDGEIEENIRAHVKLAGESCSLPAWRVQQYRRDLPQQVQDAVRAYGYYNTEIKQRFEQNEKCWKLDLDVTLGPRVQYRKINISTDRAPASLVPELELLITQPTLKPGRSLKHGEYESYKGTLLDTARRFGYWEAKYTQSELAIYPKDDAADVALKLEIGPRYRIGEQRYPDLELRDAFLRRLAGDISGEPYSEMALQDVYKRFQGTDYFRKVIITPRFEQADDDHLVPLDFDLSLAPQHSFGAGIGYSTDQGARLRGNYTNRYLNDLGHHWRADALLAERVRELLGTYIIPKHNAAKEWYELSAGYLEEEYEAYQSNTLSTSARSIYSFNDGWVVNAGVNLREETYQEQQETKFRKTLIVPGVGATWIHASEEPRQTSGYRFETGITFSHEMWASEVNFVQAYSRVKGIFSPIERGRFIARAEIAGTLMDDINALPPSVRFYTGGDNSVRGYGYNTIGIEKENGEITGGGKLIVGSIEYDHLILKSWSLSTFYDIGDAFNENPNYRKAWGVGVRWYSPVGPLRLDVAFPENSADDFRIHVSVGADL